MKKFIISIVLVLTFVLSAIPAFAAPETIDLDTMTREELHSLIDRTRTALIKFELAAESDVVLYDANGVKVTFKGYEFVADRQKLVLNTIVENNSDKTISISMDSTYINGWDKYVGFSQALEPGKKAKNSCDVYDMNEVDVLSEDDLDTLEFILSLSDKGDSYKSIDKTDALTIVFGNNK